MAYRRAETYQPPGLNSGQTAKYGALAEELQNFNSLVEQVGTPIVSDIGAARGIAEGSQKQGEQRVPIGPYNRAYNEAQLRAYTGAVYADTEGDFLRLESEAKGDPQLFEATATKRRDAILGEVQPVSAPYLRVAMDQRIAQGRSRLAAEQLKASEENTRESTLRWLDAVRRDASRLLTAGNEVSHVAGVRKAIEYGSIIDAQVAGGVLTAVEGQKLVEAALKSNATDVALGRLQGEIDAPGGDPVKIIRETLESDNPSFDAADREALGAEMMRRLSVRAALAKASLAADDAEQQARWFATEQQATVRLIDGSLTAGWLRNQVANDNMDPGLARTLYNALNEGDSGTDDPDSLQTLLIGWRDMTVPDVLGLPGLSNKTRNEYIGKITTKQADWRNSDEYQEGRQTIARSVGVSLDNLGLAAADDKQKLSDALTRFDRELSMVPPEERATKAIELADNIVKVVIKGGLQQKIATYQRGKDWLLADTLRQAGKTSIDELSADARVELDKKLAKYDKRIADAEKELAK